MFKDDYGKKVKKIGLIVIDNPLRELEGNKNLIEEFSTKEFRILLCSKLDLNDYIKFIQPEFIILPKPNFPYSKLKTKYKDQINFYSIIWEHEHGVVESFLAHCGDDPRFKPIYIGKNSEHSNRKDWKGIFLPSKIHKEILENTNNYDPDKLIVTGTLNSDNWLHNNKKNEEVYINFSGINNSENRKKRKVGISTSFKNFLFGIAYKSPLVGAFEHSNPLEDNWRLDVLRFEMEYVRILMLIFKRMPDINFEIRPHPHESKYIWRELCKKVPNVTLSKNISLINWLKSKSICINTFSTTAIDSAMQGIPSLSLDKLISKTTYERLPTYRSPFKPEFSYRPFCLDEAEKIIREKIENYNQEDKDRFKECFNKYKEVYNLEREKKATELIERFISKSLSIKPKKRNKFGLNIRILYIYLRSCYRFYKSNRKDCLLKPNAAFFCNLNLD